MSFTDSGIYLRTWKYTLHLASVYELLSQYSSAKQIASVHLTKLTNLLSTASKGRYGKEKAEEIRNAAKKSICSDMPAKSLELKHTIKLIRELDAEIEEIEFHIEIIMDEINSPILTIVTAQQPPHHPKRKPSAKH